MTKRKVGQRKEDLSNESLEKVLKTAKSLIRTDFGGTHDPILLIIKKAQSEGLQFGPDEASFAKRLAEEQVASCRERTDPRMNEIVYRLTGKRSKPKTKRQAATP